MQPALNLAQYKSDVTNLGPGKRFIIWVQGCPFDCKNCMSQEWIPFKENRIVKVEDLADLIIKTKGIDGITISGGEPMMQAQSLSNLLEIISRYRPELNIICYSGFKLKQLVWKEAVDFLSYLDVVITELYVDNLNDNKGLRGSSNQKVNFLTNRLLKHKELFIDSNRGVELSVLEDSIFITGMPPQRIQLREV